MRKLNLKKVKWIVKEMVKGASSEDVAAVQKVSQRRVQQLYHEYRSTGKLPEMRKCGRKKVESSNKERELILKTYEEYLVNALALEKVILRAHNVHIPHNRIHKVLKSEGKARDEPSKKKRRKWVRYERTHSLSLVHTDWHEYQGRQIIAFLDDASRKILALGEFENATLKNTLQVLEQAIENTRHYGPIHTILTDRGAQFSSQWTCLIEDSGGLFQERLALHGIHHVKAGRNHPQTNGKQEKWHHLYDRKRDLFPSPEQFLYWYNDRFPHMSLDFERAETPGEAFTRKMRPEYLLGAASKYFGW